MKPDTVDATGSRLRARYERAVADGRAASLRAVNGHAGPFVEQAAFTLWHRELVMRFLAENGLLESAASVAASDDDREQLARGMLCNIFEEDDAASTLELAAGDRALLHEIVMGMPSAIFTSPGSIGWCYQYWQGARRNKVNRSEQSVASGDLPALTQLFTEQYMVDFLVHNTLGAWWATRHPHSSIVEQMSYLRRDGRGRPLAGGFESWPDHAAQLQVMDPCCGSGHFLATALHWLCQMRCEQEGIGPVESGDAVIRDNLFGLDIDPRCIQFARLNIAMQAWQDGGYRRLPEMNLVCSGASVGDATVFERDATAGDDRTGHALSCLRDVMADAAHLGSLINPRRRAAESDLAAILDLPGSTVASAFRDAAVCTRLLARTYDLVLTNVPFLARKRLAPELASHIDAEYPEGSGDIATAFMLRIGEMLCGSGAAGLVSPSGWTSLRSYERFRRIMLEQHRLDIVAKLGFGAFGAISGDVVRPVLTVHHASPAHMQDVVHVLDAPRGRSVADKAEHLRRAPMATRSAQQLRDNVGSKIVESDCRPGQVLARHVTPCKGLSTGDDARLKRCFWELSELPGERWRRCQSSPTSDGGRGGMSYLVFWNHGAFRQVPGAYLRGRAAWERRGVGVSVMGRLAASDYEGDLFDASLCVFIPNNHDDLEAITRFVRSTSYHDSIRAIEDNVFVATTTLGEAAFDPAEWRDGDAVEPDALWWQHDPTQWHFDGDVARSVDPLQVAVARLVGYRWPAQFDDSGFAIGDVSDGHADAGGIVCLPALLGQAPAAERLHSLLSDAWAGAWGPEVLDRLLAGAGCAEQSLDDWLRSRSGFALQHNQLFHQRPFVWQVSDGEPDGFSALVSYHRLDRSNLDRLVNVHLQEWIDMQQVGCRRGDDGSERRLAAARRLARQLKLIAEGAPPYDVYVRWKRDWHLALAEPPPWQPDLDDGVRVNIRPFVKAGVLHSSPRLSWGTDRGRDTDGSERRNDHHFGAYGQDGT